MGKNVFPETCSFCSNDPAAARDYIESLSGWKVFAEIGLGVNRSDEYLVEFVLVRIRRRRHLPMEDVQYALAAAEYYQEHGLSQKTADDLALTLLAPCDILFAPLEALLALLANEFSADRISEIHAEIAASNQVHK